jgi:hypothetical protein
MYPCILHKTTKFWYTSLEMIFFQCLLISVKWNHLFKWFLPHHWCNLLACPPLVWYIVAKDISVSLRTLALYQWFITLCLWLYCTSTPWQISATLWPDDEYLLACPPLVWYIVGSSPGICCFSTEQRKD